MKINESTEIDLLGKAERDRSNFVRDIVQAAGPPIDAPGTHLAPPPKRLAQYWNDLNRLPKDVEACMESWKKLEKRGFEIQVFDEIAAKEFIRERLGLRFEEAFDKCYHPSMQSDYFRYCYIFTEGGFYNDADDVYHDIDIDYLFRDGRLKLQPFCYDITTAQMVSPSTFLRPGANELSWIFYFNTTPLIAVRNHPIIERALLNATTSLEADPLDELPEVQAATGPGNLTRSVFEVITEESCQKEELLVVSEWEEISTSVWPLSYRKDKRNWRLSNKQTYRPSNEEEI